MVKIFKKITTEKEIKEKVDTYERQLRSEYTKLV